MQNAWSAFLYFFGFYHDIRMDTRNEDLNGNTHDWVFFSHFLI